MLHKWCEIQILLKTRILNIYVIKLEYKITEKSVIILENQSLKEMHISIKTLK